MMDGTTTAFFYGTLMHPKILKQVIGNSGSHLRLCPAILFDYTRHRVEYATYPGIIPYTKSEKLFNRELSREEKSVRGMLVAKLSKRDVAALDVFEGDEYIKREVLVHPLEEFRDISAHSVNEKTLPKHAPSLPLPGDLLDPLPAQTYIYCDPNDLRAELWSYEEFVRDNAKHWYRPQADDIPKEDERQVA